MSVTSRINDWSNIIKNWFIILAIAGLGFFGLMSVIANVQEGSPADTGIPKYPGQASEAFTIRNTGAVILANDYEIISDGNYLLHGYWEISGGKFRYRDVDLPLNSRYFGPITRESLK